MKIAAFALVVLAGAILHPVLAFAASDCGSFSLMRMPEVTITLAQSIEAGQLSIPEVTRENPIYKTLPKFCRIAATLKPTADSDIKIEVWMPAANWNQKLEAVGNGGWGGAINYSGMAEALRNGYATTSTDTGHKGAGGAFAQDHPEKLIDFAYRSEHEMTVMAKAFIKRFYGTAPKYSYFNGCSTGGRQALKEAQNFPNDYDGIVAGDPANPRTRLASWQISLALAAVKDKASFIPPTKYPMIHKAVMETCDEIDGLKDGLIDNPTNCKFDPKVLMCKGEDEPSCLTAPQVEAAKKIMSPAVNSKSGAEIFPGYEPGTELGWGNLVAGPEAHGNAVDQFKYVVFKDPKWDWRNFDLDKDSAAADKADNGLMNAVNPDLTKFSGHGGKLILYHGWSDQQVAPRSTINYYNSVNATMGGAQKTSNWIRLFMVPGMGHCGGGEGPNTFDMVTPLEEWVEQGKAPAQIPAAHKTNGQVDRTRLLCPYPQIGKYKGTGSIDDAANFTCSGG